MSLQQGPPMIVVSEVVPVTLVGDGPGSGLCCAMIRLAGCNLACTWCDVPYSWDGSRFDLATTMPRRVVHNVVDEVLAASPWLVLVTGGEPFVQQRSRGWGALLESLQAAGVVVELHTNGTVVPGEAALRTVHRFVVSPKLAHSGEPAWTRLQAEALTAWATLAGTGQAQFSFVARDRSDVVTVASIAALHGIPFHAVWISPEATTVPRLQQVTAEVADTALQHGFNLATRPAVLAGRSRPVPPQ